MEQEEIVEEICNCIRCQHIREKTREPRKFMSYEEMFDKLEKQRSVLIKLKKGVKYV